MEPQPPGGPRRARRLVPLAAALLVAALLAVTTGDTALAQAPPDEPTLVNAGEKFIERKDDGSFIARPAGEDRGSFHAVIPVHQPGEMWGGCSERSIPDTGLRWLIQTPQGKTNGSTIYWKTNVSLVRNRSTQRGDDDA